MHISFKIIKFYFTLCCSTCFRHHCVHHQELLIAALLHMQSLVTYKITNIVFVYKSCVGVLLCTMCSTMCLYGFNCMKNTTKKIQFLP
jgi:hypothetical protein